jgi:hypothetical protein
VSWGDGTPAGEVVDEHRFDRPPIDLDGRSCFRNSLFEMSPTVALCFAPDDVGAVGNVAYLDRYLSRLRVDRITRTGSLDDGQVRRTVRSGAQALRGCDGARLEVAPTHEGDVTLAIKVRPDGTVASARVVDSDVPNKALRTCMTEEAKTWRFPKSSDGGTTRISAVFSLEPLWPSG